MAVSESLHQTTSSANAIDRSLAKLELRLSPCEIRNTSTAILIEIDVKLKCLSIHGSVTEQGRRAGDMIKHLSCYF